MPRTPTAPRPDMLLDQSKIHQILKRINERKATALTTLAGTLLMLPLAAHAQTASGPVSISDLAGVTSYKVLPDGSIEITLANGTKALVTAANVVSTADGQVMISAPAATQIEALAAAPGTEGAAAGELGGIGAAVGGLLAVGLIAGSGGGGGGGGGDGEEPPVSVSKTLRVIDAPLENALVFYDADLDGAPDQMEYLGMTDGNGALNVTYEPVAGAKFIILPAPVADAIAQYGWDEAFAGQFEDVVTRDVVTDNIFDQVLQADDTGADGDQVVSPISTLMAAGLPEEQIKEIFGLPADLDLASFDFFSALSDPDPAVRDAAQKMSAAATVMTSVVKAALTAAATGGALNAAEVQQVAAKAFLDAVNVIEKMSAGLSLAEVTEAVSGVVMAGALNPALDTDAAAQSLIDAIAGGASAEDALQQTIEQLRADGLLTDAQADSATRTADVLGNSAQDIEDIFENLDVANGADAAALEEALKEQLDAALDETDEEVSETVNETLLGIRLAGDSASATEGQAALVKGNVLENDQLADGTALPASTAIFSVNGTELEEGSAGEGSSETYVISTADWATNTGVTVPIGTIADAIGLEGNFPVGRPSGNPTRGSAIVKEITVEAGETITFDYDFGSFDYLPYNDYSFFAVKAVSGGSAAEQSGVVLRGEDNDGTMDVRDLKGPVLYNQAGQLVTATRTGAFEYTFEEAGTFTIAIGVTDVRDSIVDSIMTVRNIELSDAEGNALGTVALDDFTKLGNVAEGGDVINEITATLATGYYGSLVVTKGGDYLYQVGGENAEPIPEGVVVTDNFTYTVQLEDGRFATQTLKINVTGVADPDGELPTIQLDLVDISAATAATAAIFGTTTNATGGLVDLVISDEDAGTEDIVLTGIAVNDDGSFSAQVDVTGLTDGTLTVDAVVTVGGAQAQAGTSGSIELDTVLDPVSISLLDGSEAAPIDVQGDSPALTFGITGLAEDVTGTMTVSDGTTSTDYVFTGAGAGTTTIAVTGFAPGSALEVSYDYADNVGNSGSGTVEGVTVPVVVNTSQNIGYGSLAEAIAAAAEGDTLELAEGSFDEAVTIDKPLTLLGVQAGNSAKFSPEDLADIAAGDSPRGAESQITGTVTIAAAGVTLDGVVLENDSQPITWDEALLDTMPGALDNFTLTNSILFGYDADGAPSFNANSDAALGSYTGPAAASGWEISNNLIGGVANGNGGSMYLSGLADSSISENMFWRPGAGHLYLSSLTGTEVEGNFFYHGLHAGGANFDGLAEELGNSGGYGYGYGYGDDSAEFFGRNFWLELKGDNDGVTITGNDGQYNSGGIQIFGEEAGYSFDNITISGNIFRDFVNADPNGVLGAGRGQSGFMGAVSVSVGDGSQASGVLITGNVITAAADQVYSARDLGSLIFVQGNVAGLEISENPLTWTEDSSAAILDGLADLEVPLSSYLGALSGISLAGALSGNVLIEGNGFNADLGDRTMIGVYVVGETAETGQLTAAIMEQGNDFTGWTGQAALDMLFNELDQSYDASQLDLDTQDVFIVVQNGDTEITVPLVLGDDAANSITDMAGTQLIFGNGGADTVDLRGGGSDFVAVDGTPAAGDVDTILNFTGGSVPGSSDQILITGIDPELLSGSEIQIMTGEGDSLDEETGLLVYTNELQGSLADFLGSLEGAETGDRFYVVADTEEAEPGLYAVEVGGATQQVAFLPGLDLGSLTEDNFSLPEV